MHPRVRGLGQPPRDQRADRLRSGERPFLQGHLKPAKHGARQPDQAPTPAPPEATPSGTPVEPKARSPKVRTAKARTAKS